MAFQTVDEVLAAVEARLTTRDQGTQLLAVPPRRRPLAGAAAASSRRRRSLATEDD